MLHDHHVPDIHIHLVRRHHTDKRGSVRPHIGDREGRAGPGDRGALRVRIQIAEGHSRHRRGGRARDSRMHVPSSHKEPSGRSVYHRCFLRSGLYGGRRRHRDGVVPVPLRIQRIPHPDRSHCGRVDSVRYNPDRRRVGGWLRNQLHPIGSHRGIRILVSADGVPVIEQGQHHQRHTICSCRGRTRRGSSE